MGLVFAASCSAISSYAWGQDATDKVDEDASGTPYAAGELVVTHEPEAPEAEIDKIGSDRGADQDDAIPQIDSLLLSFSEIEDESSSEERERALERAKQALERNPAVESVDYNYLVEAAYTPNDSKFGDQWGLKRIKAPKAWNKGEGSGVDIAVLDTGIDTDHPDLKDKIVTRRNFVADPDTNKVGDGRGHGTHVSGIASAVTNNKKGVAGTCPDCQLIVGKVLDKDGIGNFWDVASGIDWAVKNGAEVINLSLSGPESVDYLRDAVNRAWANGTVVVAASGNYGNTKKRYPAAYSKAIAVGATDGKNKLASFSNYGGWVDVAAPGTGIVSTYVPEKNGGRKYERSSGTSMATPHVAGLAGLLAARGYSARKVRGIIESTTVDLRPFGKDRYHGWGLPNAAAGASCEIVGTPGSDTLEGTGRNDVVCGLGGNDTISTKAGNDVVRAGPGADVVKGGSGRDTLFGQAGQDRLRGNSGKDRLKGRDGVKGNDNLKGGRGNDSCSADRGDTRRSC